jgi:hypothetical protein
MPATVVEAQSGGSGQHPLQDKSADVPTLPFWAELIQATILGGIAIGAKRKKASCLTSFNDQPAQFNQLFMKACHDIRLHF